ncbi:MAG: DNA cytosine methyltransferase [Dermatophilaceae bacterium]|nr:DNA cytosine methyltransferase [Dermatophilaceae bacterium]
MTDLFAGAGGSSTGAASIPGVSVRYAANHWKRAVDVHNANHPHVDHICADISQYNPRRLRPTDILWASPECTNHSVAKGVRRADGQPDLFEEILPDEAAERSRATMWDVPRFAEAHAYRAVIVENVVDAAKWAPFGAWLSAMHSIGYQHSTVYLNSMHASAGGPAAPQSRDRMYVVFHRRGERTPDLVAMQRPLAWCASCSTDVHAIQSWKRPDHPWGRYRAQYVYRCPNVSCRNSVVEPYWRPASSAIDLSVPGTRIGDRTRPLADKTRSRIAKGIARYWNGPSVMEHRNVGLAVPVEGRDGKEARPTSEPLRTQTTRLETALVYPEPFIAELRGGGSTARPVSQPMATVTAAGNHHGLVTVGDLETAALQVDDCLFRMLEPSEVAAGMAFPSDYAWDGTRRERVRMAGNAVTPPAARDLVAAVAEVLR